MNVINIQGKEISRSEVAALLGRPAIDLTALQATVGEVLREVKARGDEAVKEYEERFDHVRLDRLLVSAEEMEEAERLVPQSLKDAIRLAHRNIATFHEAQQQELPKVETCPGVTCWQKAVAIERVGLYIPGGTAPLFSTVLMLATPARLAGCKEIVLCSPPNREGHIHPAILVAARMAGVSKIYKVGGVQAIAAMAYGTESVPQVYKIFGPGNRFVMAAKQAVSQQGVAIDMPAGPSEVCVIADDKGNPVFVAADLLSQAEHGADSQVLLITTSEEMSDRVQAEVARQIELLPRKAFASQSLENSRTVVVDDTTKAIALANLYAPEHLIIQTEDYEMLAERVVNAGSVFLGPYACESAGDYASGTNHTLPTHGYATAYNGVNMDSFVRKITFQHLTQEGIQSIGPAVECMAEAEELEAHKRAMEVRRGEMSSKEVSSKEMSSKEVSSKERSLIRPNILALEPYSSARNEYSGKEAHVFLDANESPFNSPYNRYPDPLQTELKAKLARQKGVRPEQIFLGNGSDEAIDLAYRCFTRPGIDNVVAIEPTYGMYRVSADINDVEYRPVLLDENFQMSAERLLEACDERTKIIWLCSPNNPTGNHLGQEEIVKVLQSFPGIVIVDEAYADFSRRPSFRHLLQHFPRLIVLQTFSKAWGCAAIRLGMAFANEEIINVYNKVKYPYNVNLLTQQHALEALDHTDDVSRWVNVLLTERSVVMRAVQTLPYCRKVYPTDANFFLARMDDAQRVYDYLVERGIIVRNRTRVQLCHNCLRITIGTREENSILIAALRQLV